MPGYLLEVDKHEQGEQQSDQAERIAARIDVGGHLDGRLEFVHIAAGGENVLALIVVGVIGPRAVGAAESRRIVCLMIWYGCDIW